MTATLDEARVSNVARSAAWIKFEYSNASSASHELTLSSQQSLQTITVSSLTVSSNSPVAGTTVTLTAQLVNAVSGTVVTFTDDTSCCTLGTAVTNASGVATFSYAIPSNATLGIHNIRAVCGVSSQTATLNIVSPLINWTYRKAITISNTNVDSDLDQLPALREDQRRCGHRGGSAFERLRHSVYGGGWLDALKLSTRILVGRRWLGGQRWFLGEGTHGQPHHQYHHLHLLR